MANEPRRCIIESMYEKPEGNFVQYAPIEVYDDSGQMHTPVKAIVELDDGKVLTVDPKSIRFTN
ncbi:hypothetical protein DT73_00405 [Mangrovibacter sp. MFB070]|uniref:hypothetical protein n=1 Tax=Mangrovibacter sp. MFB070 TaxID=1224318 RepID=UPI0004D94564|nr:hypothetical protein [Mangrovibacter sp. MFB070]KEA54659.1 hypothetical protein DT73_00405 [Mangrovibacter sp. MFB070]